MDLDLDIKMQSLTMDDILSSVHNWPMMLNNSLPLAEEVSNDRIMDFKWVKHSRNKTSWMVTSDCSAYVGSNSVGLCTCTIWLSFSFELQEWNVGVWACVVPSIECIESIQIAPVYSNVCKLYLLAIMSYSDIILQ